MSTTTLVGTPDPEPLDPRYVPGPGCCTHCRLRTVDLGSCTCGQVWNAVIPPPPCPVHGQQGTLVVTCDTVDASFDPPKPPPTAGAAAVAYKSAQKAASSAMKAPIQGRVTIFNQVSDSTAASLRRHEVERLFERRLIDRGRA